MARRKARSPVREDRHPAVAVPSRLPIRIAWIAFGLAVGLMVFARLRLRDLPLERDEGEYAYAGQLLLDGVPPYEIAYNMKLPGTYGAYALIMALLGESPAGIHAGLTVVTAATALLVFMIGMEVLGPTGGAIAGTAVALLSMSPSVHGMAGHATHFVTLPLVAGALALRRLRPRSRPAHHFLVGGMFGLALLMKQQGAFLAPFAVGYHLWLEAREKPVDWRRAAGRSALLMAGVATPLAVTCLFLWWAGVFPRFWFWTVEYARAYVSMVPLWNPDPPAAATALDYLRMGGRQAVGPWGAVWLLAAGGVVAMSVDPARRGHAPYLLGLAAVSFLAVCPGFYFRAHYFIVFLPAVALLAAAGALGLRSLLARLGKPALATMLASAVAGAALLLGLTRQADYLFTMAPEQACRSSYGMNPFPESLPVARYIRDHTEPGSRIAVVGSEPQIYFYSGRRSATGYLYTFGLMEPQPFARKMQDEMIAEIEAAKPDVVLLVNVSTSWLARPDSDTHIFRWFDDYRQRNLEVVGVVDIQSKDHTEYRWGAGAAGYRPRSRNYLTVFRRRA